jgi:hypothetical protein
VTTTSRSRSRWCRERQSACSRRAEKLARVEQPATERDQNPFVPFEFACPNYFRTLAIPILRRRGFTASDTRAPNGSSW